MIDKKIFIGILLAGSPNIIVRRRNAMKIGYQVEAFMLIPCKGRTDILLSFMQQQSYDCSVVNINNTEYLKIQNRIVLKTIFDTIPNYLIQSDRRLSLFLDAMEIIWKNKHLELDGFEEIMRLKDKMTRDDKNGIDNNQQRESDIISG